MQNDSEKMCCDKVRASLVELSARTEAEFAFHSGGENDLVNNISNEFRGKGVQTLTKLSLTSILLSFVSTGATMSKFLTTAATVTLNMIIARFCPPQILEPVPNGMKCCCIAMSRSALSGEEVSSQRSGRNVDGDGNMEASRCMDHA